MTHPCKAKNFPAIYFLESSISGFQRAFGSVSHTFRTARCECKVRKIFERKEDCKYSGLIPFLTKANSWIDLEKDVLVKS